MIRYAYKAVAFDEEEGCWDKKTLSFDKDKLERQRFDVVKVLNDLGAKGWEVIKMETNWGSWGGQYGRIYLKKPYVKRRMLTKTRSWREDELG